MDEDVVGADPLDQFDRLPALVHQMGFVAVAGLEPEFQEKVRNNIILSGGGSLISGLRAGLQDALAAVVVEAEIAGNT